MTLATQNIIDSSVASVPRNNGFRSVDLETVKPSESAISMAPGEFAMKNQVLPLWVEGDTLVVAIGTPESLAAVDDLGVLLQMPTQAVTRHRRRPRLRCLYHRPHSRANRLPLRRLLRRHTPRMTSSPFE